MEKPKPSLLIAKRERDRAKSQRDQGGDLRLYFRNICPCPSNVGTYVREGLTIMPTANCRQPIYLRIIDYSQINWLSAVGSWHYCQSLSNVGTDVRRTRTNIPEVKPQITALIPLALGSVSFSFGNQQRGLWFFHSKNITLLYYYGIMEAEIFQSHD